MSRTEFPVLARTTNRLDPFALTLRPWSGADREAVLPHLSMWESEDDGRFVVLAVRIADGVLTPYRPTLTDDWQTIATYEGPFLQVRSAACGAGCRCAGEFRVI